MQTSEQKIDPKKSWNFEKFDKNQEKNQQKLGKNWQRGEKTDMQFLTLLKCGFFKTFKDLFIIAIVGEWGGCLPSWTNQNHCS